MKKCSRTRQRWELYSILNILNETELFPLKRLPLWYVRISSPLKKKEGTSLVVQWLRIHPTVFREGQFRGFISCGYLLIKKEKQDSVSLEYMQNRSVWLEIILKKKSESRSVLSDFATLWTSPRNSPGQNTGVSTHLLLQGIEPRPPTLQADSLLPEPPGKPKNTGVGSLSLLQWIFLTQESNQGLLHCRWILYQLSYQRKKKSALKCRGCGFKPWSGK